MNFQVNKVVLEFDAQQLQVVLEGLGELPYKRSQPTMALIQQQLIRSQTNKSEAVITSHDGKPENG